jgi:putative membrane protein
VRVAKHLALAWAFNAVVLAILALVLGPVRFDGVGDLLTAAALFGILNALVRPVLRLLTLPLAVVTLGLAWFGVSMLMLAITNWVVSGFEIDGFWALVWSTIVVWLVDLVLDLFGPWSVRDRKK